MKAPGTSGSRFYRPELDVVRFLAFFLVFLNHTLPSTRDPRVYHILRGFAPVFDAFGNACGFGLSLFFTLSAFLICELLLREREASGTVGVTQFYIRRILRIWPLYYLGLALGVAVAFLPGGQPAEAARLGWFALFMGAWYCAMHGSLQNPAGVLWSVSVEEQFYLLAPWMMKYLNRKSLYCFCLALIVLANAWLFYLGTVGAFHYGVWCNCFVQFECFAGGILLCLALRGRLPRLAAWQRITLIVFSFSLWFYASYGLNILFANYGERNPDGLTLIAGYSLVTLACVLFLAAFLGLDQRLLPGWAIYLGRISYGLYVFHEFAIYVTNHLISSYIARLNHPIVDALKGPVFLLNLILTLGLTILVAVLSYRYVETPFLKLKKRHSVIESQPILGAG